MKYDSNKALVEALIQKDSESTWFEFKMNNCSPEAIGKYISALSNSAAIDNRQFGYMIWGIDDRSHEIASTSFSPYHEKVGNQELINWLLSQVEPRLNVVFDELEYPDNKKVILMTVPAAFGMPTAFRGIEYIRIGSYTNKLKDYPEKERVLWKRFERIGVEDSLVLENISEKEILFQLDADAYYRHLKLSVPEEKKYIVERMSDEGFIVKNDNNLYSITYLGALLFAKNMKEFPSLSRRCVRVIEYEGNSRVNAIQEREFSSGYGISFEQICLFTQNLVPHQEKISNVYRETEYAISPVVIREMIANMLIHQDLSDSGMNPMVEVFQNRIEVSGPGAMSISIDRIIDSAPHCRNEKLASFLRRIHICEERGSGFDRIEEALSLKKLPSLIPMSNDDFTRVIVKWGEAFAEWSLDDKLKTVYYYICFCYVNNEKVSNSLLRERLGIPEKNKAIVSRLVNEAIKRNLIKIEDETVGAKSRRYIPYWG